MGKNGGGMRDYYNEGTQRLHTLIDLFCAENLGFFLQLGTKFTILN